MTGTIIGSGIWVTPGFIMTYSGSVGVYLLQWAVCGVLAAMGRYYINDRVDLPIYHKQP